MNMKKIALILTLLVATITVNAQKGRFEKPDSNSLINNILYQYTNGIAEPRGVVVLPPFQTLTQNLRYDSIWGTYTSIGANKLGVVGQYNLAIGQNAFENNISGNYNTALGKNVMKFNTRGNHNVAIGWEALLKNTSGSDNVGISTDALYSNINGYGNTAIGRGTMFYSTAGRLNVAVGYNALMNNIDGEGNTAIGPYSMTWLIKGSNNIAIGPYSGEANGSENVTIDNSIFIGNQSGLNARHSNSIAIGTKTEVPSANRINIGNVYKGDILTGNAEVKSISISDRKITVDDNYLYVVTSTGVIKRVPLQDLSATSKAVSTLETSKQIPASKYAAYTTTGQLLYLVKIQ